MDLSEENKILLLILLVAVAFWLFSGQSSDKKKAKNNKKTANNASNNFNDEINNKDQEQNDSLEHFDSDAPVAPAQSTPSVMSAYDSSPSSRQESVESNSTLSQISTEQENKVDNKCKSINFKDGQRYQKSNELDKFFEGNYPKNSQDNNGFSAMVNNDIGAAYTSGNAEKLSDKDKFNPESLLPREKNSEWADDPYEQVNVKSSTLAPANANIFRPVGINTVQSTKKFASHDFRAVPKAPKLNVSPWNMSSADGDNNIRNDSLCV